MPLTELMHYFNDQLQTQARLNELPKTGLFKVDNQYRARFGNLVLGSQFAEMRRIDNGELIGHYADLFVRSTTGNVLNIDAIVNSLESTEEVVHLDRLVRTLHSLNYLQQHDGFKGVLALHVQAKHILSVPQDHGKTFEKILSDCGLNPERVILHTKLVNELNLAHFQQALSNYRERHYRIGIHLETLEDWSLLQQLLQQSLQQGLPLVSDYIFANTRLASQLDREHNFMEKLQILVANLDESERHPLVAYSTRQLTGYVQPSRLAS